MLYFIALVSSFVASIASSDTGIPSAVAAAITAIAVAVVAGMVLFRGVSLLRTSVFLAAMTIFTSIVFPVALLVQSRTLDLAAPFLVLVPALLFAYVAAPLPIAYFFQGMASIWNIFDAIADYSTFHNSVDGHYTSNSSILSLVVAILALVLSVYYGYKALQRDPAFMAEVTSYSGGYVLAGLVTSIAAVFLRNQNVPNYVFTIIVVVLGFLFSWAGHTKQLKDLDVAPAAANKDAQNVV
ncbi:Aste57867_12085 [Aphanomyces stellatus]|uniref:Aste57867_12085 protein n=1 Tax=Aphanomyces stellatus TaxID=120398 RepID=A0A485KUL1_9STRA|nr:hypothetical protein As57867_012040 [Aphanomyces stellatus]VFT88940.1 Aste57867_12085 [Aphanomyces stellatus]